MKARYDEWSAMRDRVIKYFEHRGAKLDCFGDADFWIIDDWLFPKMLQVELYNLAFMNPEIIRGLRVIATQSSSYMIAVQIVSPRDGPHWPRMGLVAYRGKIDDGLKRRRLPLPYRDYVYE